MSVPDALVERYFFLCTDVPEKNIAALKATLGPKELKERLGFEIVKLYHGEKAAHEAQENFEKIFSKKDLKDADIPVVKVPDEINLVDLIVLCFKEIKIEKSRGEARRLIIQKSLKIDGRVWDDPKMSFKPQTEVISIGRFHFRLIPKWSL